MTTYTCAWCKGDKTEEQMVKRSRLEGGLAKHCRECHKAKYSKPGGRRLEHLKKRYDLTPEQYDAMLSKQNGACGICYKVKHYHLHVDHCHSTGLVRGLLCAPCNRAVGLLQDDADRADRLAGYLRQDP